VPVSKAEQANIESEKALSSLTNIKIPARILLAEDSYTNALVASSFLNAAGARIDIASNGLEVLTACEQRRYDLIIMDVSMPEMDGIEASEILRKQDSWTKTAPILALTANASHDDKERCLKAGMSAFLTKPIERTKLLQTVQSLLAEKQNHFEKQGVQHYAQQIFDHSSIVENYGDIQELFTQIV